MRIVRKGAVGALSLMLMMGVTVVAAGSASASSAKGPSSFPTTALTNNFSAMSKLKALAKAGKGKVAAILPDTTSSTRYVEFDEPDLTKAFQAAGLKSSQYVIQNALGSDATQLTDAQTDITNGATVLLVDPIDPGVGVSIESYAKSHEIGRAHV